MMQDVAEKFRQQKLREQQQYHEYRLQEQEPASKAVQESVTPLDPATSTSSKTSSKYGATPSGLASSWECPQSNSYVLPKPNKKFADYSTRAPAVEYRPFMVIHEETGAWEPVNATHIQDVVWDASSMEWIGFDEKFEVRSVQSRPRDWPRHWQWPFDVLRNRESSDGPCLNCARGPKEPCLCLPGQWRYKIDWEPLRVLFYSEEAGIGVRTRTAWKKGDVLGDYVGVLRPYNNYEENFYSFVVPVRKSNSEWIAMIDASKAGNWTRFMNHSKDDPNVEIALNRVGSQRLLVARALRDIGYGEELRLHYGYLWFFEDSDPYKPRCRDEGIPPIKNMPRERSRSGGRETQSPDRRPQKRVKTAKPKRAEDTTSYVTVRKEKKTTESRVETQTIEKPRKQVLRKTATARMRHLDH